MKGVLIISASNKEKCIEMLNKHFYSTTYDINDQNQVTWKSGEIKTHLKLIINKTRFKIYQQQ